MAWQQNQKLGELFREIEEVNKQRKNDEVSLAKALELNSVHHKMLEGMHQEIESLKLKLEEFKDQMTKHAFLALKKDMEKYANLIALDRLQTTVNHYLDSNLEILVTQILKTKRLL